MHTCCQPAAPGAAWEVCRSEMPSSTSPFSSPSPWSSVRSGGKVRSAKRDEGKGTPWENGGSKRGAGSHVCTPVCGASCALLTRCTSCPSLNVCASSFNECYLSRGRFIKWTLRLVMCVRYLPDTQHKQTKPTLEPKYQLPIGKFGVPPQDLPQAQCKLTIRTAGRDLNENFQCCSPGVRLVPGGGGGVALSGGVG